MRCISSSDIGRKCAASRNRALFVTARISWLCSTDPKMFQDVQLATSICRTLDFVLHDLSIKEEATNQHGLALSSDCL